MTRPLSPSSFASSGRRRARHALLIAGWVAFGTSLPRAQEVSREASPPAPVEAPTTVDVPLERVLETLEVLRAEDTRRRIPETIAKLRAEIGRLRMDADHAARRLVEIESSSEEATELTREHAHLSKEAEAKSAVVALLRAIDREPDAQTLGVAEGDSIPHEDVDGLARWIDTVIARVQEARGVEPAPPVDDAGFLRRAWLDIAGTLPSEDEIRRFHESPAASRRAELIDRLVTTPRFGKHRANYWSVELLGRGYLPDDKHRQPFVDWLERELSGDLRYDQFVRALITNTKSTTKEVSPTVFLAARQSDAIANTNKVVNTFLGTQLQCAQCHDHPYQSWSQRDFHGMAAFLVRQYEKDTGGNVYVLMDRDKGEARYRTPGGADHVASPKYLDGTEPPEYELDDEGKPRLGDDGLPIPVKRTRRELLADFMVADLQLARTQVNRWWKLLVGHGFIEPLDGFSEDTRPAVPLVLDTLARKLQESGFDVRWLVRVIARTEAYGRSSQAVEDALADESFASYPTRALTGEQMFDAIASATLLREALVLELDGGGADGATPKADGLLRSLRDDFIEVYAWEPGKVIDPDDGTLPQALALMNNRLVIDACRAKPGSTVAVALELDDEACVRRLWRAALTREPRADELERAVSFLAAAPSREEAAGDLLWSLLNSAEFRYNN